MFAKIKPTMFLNSLKFEFPAHPQSNLKAVLRDEAGKVHSMMERDLTVNQHELTWEGLDHLPYGIYTIELSQGEDAMQMRLVKKA